MSSDRATRGDAPDALTLLQPLTAKPVLFVANVDEGGNEFPPAILGLRPVAGADTIAISARLEAELGVRFRGRGRDAGGSRPN